MREAPACHTLSQMKSHDTASSPVKLLFVDDNKAFRDITAMALCSRGYDVESCGSAEAAVELASGSQFQLLITDVVLGKTNGVELAARIREVLPDIKVLFCSGYPKTALVRQGLNLSMGGFLMKPMSIGALCAAIEQLLNPVTVEDAA